MFNYGEWCLVAWVASRYTLEMSPNEVLKAQVYLFPRRWGEQVPCRDMKIVLVCVHRACTPSWKSAFIHAHLCALGRGGRAFCLLLVCRWGIQSQYVADSWQTFGIVTLGAWSWEAVSMTVTFVRGALVTLQSACCPKAVCQCCLLTRGGKLRSVLTWLPFCTGDAKE